MKTTFALQEIYGKKPAEVARLFKSRGINPTRPYRAQVTFAGITIEQD
jgi:hypothetical protein